MIVVITYLGGYANNALNFLTWKINMGMLLKLKKIGPVSDHLSYRIRRGTYLITNR